MQKMKMAVVVLAGLMFFNLGSMARAAAAQQAQMTWGDRLEIGGGLSYNTYDLSDVKNGEVTPHDEKLGDLQVGSGFYLNGNYWITPYFGFQAGYDFSSADATYEGVSFVEQHNELTGRFIGIAGRWGDSMKVHLSVGSYDLEETASIAGISVTNQFAGPAVMGGVQLSAPISQSVSLHGTADLRIAGVSVKSENSEYLEYDSQNYTNVSGVRLGVGIDVKF